MLNRRFLKGFKLPSITLSLSAEQNLILYLDANDVDSYDGDGSVWYDISEHDVTIPLSDNASNLKCHLNFSDSTSYGGTGTTVTDISDESNDFTFTGITASDFDKDNGGYVDLDNSGDYLERSSTTSGHFDGDYTLELWINPHENNNFTYFYCKQSASLNGLLIGNFGGSTGQLEVYRYTTSGSSNADTFTGSGITANQWNHVAIVFSGTKGFLYVNGEQKDSSTSFTGTYPADFTNMKVGGGYSTAFDTNGEIGVFRLYDKALSASEVGQNYRYGRDLVYTSLIADTNLELDFDPTSITSDSFTTWVDSKSSASLTKNGTIERDQELGDFVSFGGTASDGFSGAITNTIKDGNNDYSIEYWWYYDSISNTASFVAGKQSASFYGNYIYQTASTLYFDEYKSGTYSGAQSLSESYSTLGVTTGKWYHFTWVVDASTDIKLYIDGELKKTSTTGAGGTRWSALTNLEIGKSQSSYIGQGDCGGVRFYKQPLTADEVMQNYLFTKNNYPNSVHMSNFGAIFDTSTHTNPDVDAFSFDGSNDYFDSSTFNTNLGSSSYTLSAWIYVQGALSGSGAYVIMATLASSSGLQLDIIKSNGNLRLYHSGGTAVNQQSSSSLSVNTWYHVICIRDRELGKVNFFIDGVAAGSTSIASANGSADGSGFEIGRYNSGYYFNGDIAQVKVFDKAMTTAEAQALFNQNATTFGKTEV